MRGLPNRGIALPTALVIIALGGCGKSGLGQSDDVETDGASTGTVGAAGAAGVGGAAGAGGAGRVPKSHRVASVSCPAERGQAPTTSTCPPAPMTTGSNCTLGTSSCSAGRNGRCLAARACLALCSYDDCVDDVDCPAAVPCNCRESATDWAKNECLTESNCRTDADCGVGGYCSPSLVSSGCSCVSPAFCKPPDPSAACGDSCGHGYFCHTPADECLDDADCPGGGPCGWDLPSRRWICPVCVPRP